MLLRKLNYSDDVLVQYANKVLSEWQEDLPAFTAFDPELGEAKRDEMSQLVTWALNEDGDDLNVSKLGDLTDALLQELENARRLYQQLRYWVIKAFPERVAVKRQFGIGRYRKVAGSQEAMISFFNSLKQSVEDYRTALEAVNTPPSLLDGVDTQAEALSTAQQAQEKKKGDRTIDTEERIKSLNQLYAYTQAFNAAAEFVYYDSAAKRDLYRPPNSYEPDYGDDEMMD
jgi:hypothetical protein